MKFIKAAIAAIAALATLGEAKLSGDKNEMMKTLNHRMKNNLYNKDVLMQGAKPHNKAAEDFEAKRKLGDFEITADYSIQFISCFSLSTSYDELFEQNQNEGGGIGLMLMSQGNAIPERSYAIFKLCYTSHCDYTGNDPSLEYVIDLSVYVQALVMYLPEQVENFCAGCQENEDACYAQLYGGYGYAGMYGANGQAYGQNAYQNQQQGQQQNYNVNNVNYNNNGQYQQANAQQMSNGNDGNRRGLAAIHNAESRRLQENQVVRQLDCNLCLQYNCIEPMDGNNNWNDDIYGFEAAAEWLTMISQCYQTGAVYSGNGAYYQQGGQNQGNMYAGFLCNDQGNGVEIGMFLDEMCVLYLPNEPFSNYMNLYDSTYQSMTSDIIEFTFSDAKFNCKDEEVVYTTQNVDGYYNYQNYNWNANQEAEAAEWCQYLSNNELGVSPISLYNCGGAAYGNYYGYNMYNDDNQYKNMYSWYQYEISEDDAVDMQEVCLAVKKANGELHTFYNGNNGHSYTYSSSGSSEGVSDSSVTDFLEDTENTTVSYDKRKSLTGAAKFGIIAAVGVVVGAIVAVVIKVRSGSDKSEPLMEGEVDGTMA